MKQIILKAGDYCWIHGGPVHQPQRDLFDTLENGPSLTKAKVVHSFLLYGLHYVVEVETEVEPVLYVRDPLTVSDAPDRPIGFWRKP